MPVDMSPEAIDARLRETARLTDLRPPFPVRVDMSPAGIDARLREVAQLYRLNVELQRLRPASSDPR